MGESTELRLAASLWSVDRGAQRAALELAVAGGIDAVHWDVADGALGPAGGFTARRAEELSAELDVAAEAHLMVADPLSQVDEWTALCDRVVVHVESAGWRAAFDRIATRGCTPALAISPGTPTSEIPDDVEHVLVMSVAPGTASSGFLTASADRARAIARATSRTAIGWDGSVDLVRVAQAKAAHVNWLISGGALVGHSAGPEHWVRTARKEWSATADAR